MLTIESSIGDYLAPLAGNWKLISWITVAVMLIAVLVSSSLPPLYRAETRMLPPQLTISSSASPLMNQLTQEEQFPPLLLGIRLSNQLFIGMLRSRTVRDRIVDRFQLMDVYGSDSRQTARSILEKATDVSTGQYGFISVSVVDQDPQRAADMANAFIEELKRLTKALAVTEASQKRLFLEEQLEHVREKLNQAERSLQAFQERTGVIIMEEQAEAMIESIAQLMAQIAAKEVELKVMRTYATAFNPDLKKIIEELSGMKEQLSLLDSKDGSTSDNLVLTGMAPAVGTDHLRLLRDLKYYETLYGLMATQYDFARVAEAQNAVLVQVLDEAIPPETHFRRWTMHIVIAAFLVWLSLVFALVYLPALLEQKTATK